jgi:hypothetical protein
LKQSSSKDFVPCRAPVALLFDRDHQQSDYLSSFAVTLTIEFSLTARSEIQSSKPCLTS